MSWCHHVIHCYWRCQEQQETSPCHGKLAREPTTDVHLSAYITLLFVCNRRPTFGTTVVWFTERNFNVLPCLDLCRRNQSYASGWWVIFQYNTNWLKIEMNHQINHESVNQLKCISWQWKNCISLVYQNIHSATWESLNIWRFCNFSSKPMFDLEIPHITNILVNYSGITGIGLYLWTLPGTYLHIPEVSSS